MQTCFTVIWNDQPIIYFQDERARLHFLLTPIALRSELHGVPFKIATKDEWEWLQIQAATRPRATAPSR